MAAHSLAGKLVVIVGETGSGKSALALDLAERLDGEIVCADSRTVYQGMDIGTAKPSSDNRRRVPHHLLDVIKPGQPFTVADFKQQAEQAILDIQKRGRVPFLVGGSGLYVDAVLYDFGFAASPSARDPKNPRHAAPDQPQPHQPLRPQTLILGVQRSREELESRLRARADAMLKAGLLDEVKDLTGRLDEQTSALQAPAYRAFRRYLKGELTLDEAKDEFVMRDMQLAKRQRTWFKRNKSIQWLDDPRYVIDIVTTFLNKTGE